MDKNSIKNSAYCSEKINYFYKNINKEFNKLEFPNYCNESKIIGHKKDKIKILFFLIVHGKKLFQILRLFRLIYSKEHLYLIHVDSVFFLIREI